MAGEIPDLIAEVRTGTGKGAARQSRRDGMVPGVVYGGGVDPLPIEFPFNVLLKKLKAGRFLSTLRITSYNVCYTKLLRVRQAHDAHAKAHGRGPCIRCRAALIARGGHVQAKRVLCARMAHAWHIV